MAKQRIPQFHRRRDPERDKMLSVRLTTEQHRLLEQTAEKIGRREGITFSKADVVRMALDRFYATE